MDKERGTLKVRVDWYTRACLTAIAVLMTVLIIGLWADYTPQGQSAFGGSAKPFVESGTQAQIIQVVKAQDRTTAKLTELIALLRSGQVKVEVVGAKAKGGGQSNGTDKTKK